jgi:hypothetical protein
MAEIPTRYLVHQVTVEPYTGTGSYGDVYDTPRTRACLVDEKRQLVRNTDGDEVISEATLYLRRTHLQDFEPGSRVTLPTGRRSTVIVAADRSDGGLGAWQHLEVAVS